MGCCWSAKENNVPVTDPNPIAVNQVIAQPIPTTLDIVPYSNQVPNPDPPEIPTSTAKTKVDLESKSDPDTYATPEPDVESVNKPKHAPKSDLIPPIEYKNGDEALHIWDYKNATWILMYKALETWSKKQIHNKPISATSKKYAGLEPNEVLMYQAIESCTESEYDIIIPHELLMIILIYSQGYKFEAGDIVCCFAAGLFGQSDHALVCDIIEDDKNTLVSAAGRGPSYLVRRLGYDGKPIGIKLNVPFNYTFGCNLVIINEAVFHKKYPKATKRLNLVYGDVLEVKSMFVEQKEVYSKKKGRNTMKSYVRMQCTVMEDKWKRKKFKSYQYWSDKVSLTVKYESNVFAQAKWKKITDA